MNQLSRAVMRLPSASALRALASRRLAVLSKAGLISAIFCTRVRIAAKSAPASTPQGAARWGIERGWSQSTPWRLNDVVEGPTLFGKPLGGDLLLHSGKCWSPRRRETPTNAGGGE